MAGLAYFCRRDPNSSFFKAFKTILQEVDLLVDSMNEEDFKEHIWNDQNSVHRPWNEYDRIAQEEDQSWRLAMKSQKGGAIERQSKVYATPEMSTNSG